VDTDYESVCGVLVKHTLIQTETKDHDNTFEGRLNCTLEEVAQQLGLAQIHFVLLDNVLHLESSSHMRRLVTKTKYR